MSTHEAEIKSGQRFEFGRNWADFSTTLTPERIRIAELSLIEMLRMEDLSGKKFLDAGSGSGLFSLAARNLGATVHSFDFDPESVSCTQSLRKQFFANDPGWLVEEGSVLDPEYLGALGEFDIVYSWGVLHHTGDMWAAIENVAGCVKPGGLFFIAIYNDQGDKSRYWRRAKEIYCSGVFGKALILATHVPYFFIRAISKSIIRRHNAFSHYKNSRGMSILHDWYDWLGGLPFEVASVENIFLFLQSKGFDLQNIRTTNGNGNNQFVFLRKV